MRIYHITQHNTIWCSCSCSCSYMIEIDSHWKYTCQFEVKVVPPQSLFRWQNKSQIEIHPAMQCNTINCTVFHIGCICAYCININTARHDFSNSVCICQTRELRHYLPHPPPAAGALAVPRLFIDLILLPLTLFLCMVLESPWRTRICAGLPVMEARKRLKKSTVPVMIDLRNPNNVNVRPSATFPFELMYTIAY